MKFLPIILGIASLIAPCFASEVGLEISAADQNAEEAKQVLISLLQKYDLKDYIYTKRINIESGKTPHSHPILTLKSEDKDNPDAFLGSFIHEQMHWFWIKTSPGPNTGPRIDFKKKYPHIPTASPSGSGDESSTYQHIGVCWLEYQGLIKLIGEKRARAVLSKKQYYMAIYRTVLNDSKLIEKIMKKYGMDKPGK